MAFLRFTRDKRGYEHFYLVQPSNRRGRSASRVLYWFRTPPNVRVGREPFDEAIRRALEAQHPDVAFDWPKLIIAPVPAAEPERWRERRSADRAAKAAGRADTGADADDGEAHEAAVEELPPLPAVVALSEAVPTGPAPNSQTLEGPQSPRRHRRRRRGRGSRRPGDAVTSLEPTANGASPAVPPPDVDRAVLDRSELAAPREAAEARDVADPIERPDSPDHAEPRDRSDS
jgi:hypothetical protein